MRAWMIGAAIVLAGCTSMPMSGPTIGAIETAALESDSTLQPFAFAAITPETLEVLDRRRREPPSDLTRGGGQNFQLKIGDVVSVTIWEAVEGGVFSGNGMGNRASGLPRQRIGDSGAISVPYAGRIRAAGRTPEAVASAIVAALEGKAIEPQVLVTLDTSPVSAVTVIGDALGKAGRIPLAGVGERVLDVLATAGGASIPAHQALVRLTRGDAQAETHLSRILREPAQNVRVMPGDVLTVMNSNESYSVMGAANRPRRMSFSAEIMPLDEALADVGGLSDNSASPSAVYVFRYEPTELARQLPPVPDRAPEGREPPSAGTSAGLMSPVVYNLDLSDPGSFFLARRFVVQDGDIIYVANADFANAQKVLRVFASVLTPAAATLRLINDLN